MTEESKKNILENGGKILCRDDDDYAILKEVIWSKGLEEFEEKVKEECGENSLYADLLAKRYVFHVFHLRKAAKRKTGDCLKIHLPLSEYKTNEDTARTVNSNPDQYVLYEFNKSKNAYTGYRVNEKGELERI